MISSRDNVVVLVITTIALLLRLWAINADHNFINQQTL
jgi:hypothetical protein